MRSSHGQTPAGWISVAVMLLGSLIGAFGIGSGLLWLTIAGAVVFAGGILAAKLLQLAGFGQYPPSRSRRYDSAEDYLGSHREEDPRQRRAEAEPGAHAAS